MSMYLKAIEKENTKHTNGGGSLGELKIVKIKNPWAGDLSFKVNCCVCSEGKATGLLEKVGKFTGQLQ